MSEMVGRIIGNFILWSGIIIICVSGSLENEKTPTEDEVDDLKSAIQEPNLLPEGYDKYEEPPSDSDSQDLINVTLLINEVPNLNENEQDITFTLYVKLYWPDARLANLTALPGNTLPRSLHDKIWTPELSVGRITSYEMEHGTFFGHYDNVLKPPIIGKYVDEITIDGPDIISYTAKLSVTHSCGMNFIHYPLDVQKCEVRFVVEAGERQVDTLLGFNRPYPGIVYQGNFDTQNFDVGLKVEDAQTETKPRKMLSPKIDFYFARKFGFHLLLVYPPSVLLDLITWFTLFLPVDHTTDRIQVGITVLLTLIALFGTVRLTGPSVSYVKAVDSWMVVSVIFTFVVIMETFIVVNIVKGNISLAALKRLKLLPSKKNHPPASRAVQNPKIIITQTGSVVEEGGGTNPERTSSLNQEEPTTPNDNALLEAGGGVVVVAKAGDPNSTLFTAAAHRLDLYARTVILSIYLIYSTFYWCWLGLYYIYAFDKNDIRGCTWCW